MNIVKIFLLMLTVCFWHSQGAAQLVGAGGSESLDLESDTLGLQSEWWLGATIAGSYSMAFGTLTTQYIGGTAPGAGFATAQTQGGYGFGVAVAPTIEYRSLGSSLSVLALVGVDHQYTTSSSTVPVSNEPYAVNALFEFSNTTTYFSAALLAKYALGRRGYFLMLGPSFSLPLVSDSYLWQNEVLVDSMQTGETPGFPNTSIKFDTSPQIRPRIGVSLGIGIDIMSGLFGYTGQLLTPYITFNAGTPVVSEPTPWNAISARLGVIWRTGL